MRNPVPKMFVLLSTYFEKNTTIKTTNSNEITAKMKTTTTIIRTGVFSLMRYFFLKALMTGADEIKPEIA